MSEEVLQPRLKNSEASEQLDSTLGHLDVNKCKQVIKVIKSYPCLFSDIPNRTTLIVHDVDIGDARPISQRFYRVSPVKRKILDSEVIHSFIHVGKWHCRTIFI